MMKTGSPYVLMVIWSYRHGYLFPNRENPRSNQKGVKNRGDAAGQIKEV